MIRQIVPGLAPERVRAMLGPPDKAAKRPSLSEGESANLLAVIEPLIAESSGLPPLSPGGDDWVYEKSWQEQVDSRLIDVWQGITVSFDNAGKVEDCRVTETRFVAGKLDVVLPSRDPRFSNDGEIRCAELPE